MRKVVWTITVAFVIFGLVFSSACGGKKTTTVTPPPDNYRKPHSRPGPAAEKLTFKAFHVDQAVIDIQADNMDVYLFGLKIAAAQALEGKAGIKSYKAPASSVSLIMNPAPAPSGKLNPFSLPKVRQAMNYLIDREFIAREIYGGLAMPMVSLVSPTDLDYETITPILEKAGINYDFEYAKSLVSQAMTEAGAKLTDGKWHYQGQLIRLKFIIRTEDERREIGDFVGLALEKAGFQVEPVYKTFAAAVYTVYTSDPQSFEWHLYTEGWGRGGAEKYDFATVNQMSAPWMANMPGWQIIGFWQYQNDELDQLGKKLFTGSFSSKNERDEIYRQMVKLSLDDPVRLWVVTVYNTFPAKEELIGVTEDVVAGPKGLLTLREAYLPGKDTLRVGNLWVWTERTVWNPIGGFEDIYSVDIWKNLYDPPIIHHPFTGLPMPFRVSYEVETAGPQGKMDIPPDAAMWDAKDDIWKQVPAGSKSASKVIFDYSKYFQSSWHHGRQINMSDVLYSIYQSFEMTYDQDKKKIEFVLAQTQKPFLDTFRGFRVLDENKIEVYLDYWHFESDYIASYASPASLSIPWEVLAAMDKLIFEDRIAAYSKTSAARYSVSWLSLAESRDSAKVIKALKELNVPNNVFSPLGENVALDYQSFIAWFNQYGHLVISQGPFKLVKYDPPAQYAELQAFRDADYPFKPGDWYYGKSR